MSEECGSCEYNRQCFIKKNVGIFECEKEKVSSLITYLYETMNGELALDYANLDSEKIEILLDYIENLENIIKEVREYILTHKLYCFEYDEEELFEITTDKKAKDEILKILDKVSDE